MKMKRKTVILGFVVTFILAMSSVGAFAAPAGISQDEERVLDAFRQVTFLTANQINQAQNYLITIDLPADKCDTIIACTQEANEIATKAGIKKYTDVVDLTQAEKSIIEKDITSAANAANVVCNWNFSNGKVHVTTLDGRVLYDAQYAVKRTGLAGSETIVISLAFILLLVGGLSIYAKKKKYFSITQ
jgi:hypothetical protein